MGGIRWLWGWNVYSVANLAVLSACGISESACGAGFAIMEQSVQEMGRAFSGAAAGSDDASMVFFNPGAMGQVRGGMITGAGYLVAPTVRFRDQGSSESPALGGDPLTGGQGGDAGVTRFIPNLYAVHEISNRWVAGIGFNVPYATHSRYDASWQGRYQALETRTETFNINPSLAFRVDETLSFGAGLDIQYLRTKFTNAVDFGAVCAQVLEPRLCGQVGLSPQGADGRLKISGDSVAFGYNLGLLYAPLPTTRFGFAYRSGIDHHIDGRADFTVPAVASPLNQTGVFDDTAVRTSARLPDTVLFGFRHRFNDQWTLSGDALWTRWSRFQNLSVRYASPQPRSTETLGWHDSWRGALGLDYDWLPDWRLRIGVAYDESPVPDASMRTPRLSDSDRIWLTSGISWKLADEVSLHAAYGHLFFRDGPIRHTGVLGDRLAGVSASRVDIFGVQFDWRF